MAPPVFPSFTGGVFPVKGSVSVASLVFSRIVPHLGNGFIIAAFVVLAIGGAVVLYAVLRKP